MFVCDAVRVYREKFSIESRCKVKENSFGFLLVLRVG